MMIVTLFSGLYFSLRDYDYFVDIFIFTFMLIVNFVFMIFWLYLMLKEYVMKLINIIKRRRPNKKVYVMDGANFEDRNSLNISKIHEPNIDIKMGPQRRPKISLNTSFANAVEYSTINNNK